MVDEIALVLQLAVGLVFLLSAAGKLINPLKFARGVMEYQILPAPFAFSAGLLLIALEIFLALSHLTGWLLRYAAPLALAALASFALAVAINLKRGRALPCYCFGGQGGEKISARTIARLLLLFASELIVLGSAYRSAVDTLVYPGRIANASELGLSLLVATFVMVAGLWLLSAADIKAALSCSTCKRRTARGHSSSTPTGGKS